MTTTAEPAGQGTEQAFVDAHEALLKTRGIQFDFQALEIPDPPGWVEPLLQFLRLIAPIFQYVFWGGVILGVLVIAYVILRELLPERLPWTRRRAEPPAADWRPQPEAARSLLEEADRLAAAGRYEEAIHLILFRSIDDLAGRRPGLVKPALTSRDIAGLEAIPGEPRDAFARITEAVERSFFGGRAAGAEDFGRARRDYEAFAFAEGWR